MITMGFPAFPLLILILLPFTTSQSYGNITYNRLGIVESIHQLPRYDQNFHRSSNTFNIDTNDLHNEYTESVIVVPILLTCLIFVAFTLFELALCCRYCCACCSCIQHRPDRESIGSMAIWTEKVTKSKVSLIRGFWILVFLSLIACQGVIPAAIFLMAGSQKGINSVDNLYDVAVELKNSGEYLENSGDTILDLTASAIPSCPEASYVQTYADDFETYVTDYQDIINPIPNDLNTLEDFIHAYAVKVVTISIWSTYAVVLVTLLVIVLSYRSRSRILVKVSIGWGTIVLHTLLVVWCLSMIAMIVMADFCMKPTDNALSVTPDSAIDVATYYGTCNGTNPFDESLTAAYEAVDDLNTSITFLVQPGGLCEGNPYLLACYPSIDDIYSNLTVISDNIQCPPIQDEWVRVFNKAICQDYYAAIYTVFNTLIAMLVTFFPLMILSSLLYQYFGILWRTEEGHILEIPFRDSEGNPLGSLPGISVAGESSDPSSTYSTMIYDEKGIRNPVPPPSYSLSKDYTS